jgi:hypothetical protein
VLLCCQFKSVITHRSGRPVWGVGLRPLDCWDRGFESRIRHGYSSVVFVVCSQIQVYATSWSLVRGVLPSVCVSNCVWYIFFPMTQQPLGGLDRLIFRRFTITHFRHTTLDTTPLDEWSARRRDLYLTTHNTHNRQTYMPPVGFEPTILVSERPQTHVLDRAATGIGCVWYRNLNNEATYTRVGLLCHG